MGTDFFYWIVSSFSTSGLRLDGNSSDGIRDVLLSGIVYLQAISSVESGSHILCVVYYLVGGWVELYFDSRVWFSSYIKVFIFGTKRSFSKRGWGLVW